jgi:diacylglycerol kinase (ATP)
VSVIVIVNARSRANRRDPGLAERLAALVRDTGRVLLPRSLEDMATHARALAQAAPQVIAVHGGDGTLHQTISALFSAFGERPLPPLAILPGGTMNVVAASLRLRARPELVVQQLAEQVRAGHPLETVRRRCLRIENRYGFVFGNGLMANFLEEYYRGRSYSSRRALWMLFRTFSSAAVGGRYARRICRRFEGKVVLDGRELPWRALTAVGAATVTEVGLGFKLNPRADEDPDRFAALAAYGGPLGLSLDLWPVHQGRGISPRRAWSGVASSMRLEPSDGQNLYTIDGDLYRHQGPLEITLGPALRFFRPRQALEVQEPRQALEVQEPRQGGDVQQRLREGLLERLQEKLPERLGGPEPAG